VNDFRHWYRRKGRPRFISNRKLWRIVMRDEFPLEANMRCYETVAGGALLITPMPTELGFSGRRPLHEVA
jgi:formylmethanofuran:tetrahydromethanopterin formyltransferase